LFGRVDEVRIGGAGFDVPVLTSLNLPALVLAAAAAIAVFRFKAGMIPVLLVSAGLGAAYVLIV
ncbi:MAG TPA: chromate transporter, partial [Sphingomicrobium sp.]|nr:chromate transporter [Sphingomicrobium sp.]